ncbi:alpha/beta fold hydrolase [Mycobacterium uberis]|uniref:alpha/beta fold hydrolase n=1 Tax=Mycobacterium uberis TaxID=2162698 RepID=UPI000E305F7C|nr:hypothetical protein [Mycobacterium uberis]
MIDAVGCQQVTIFTLSFHAMNGLALAAYPPERVRSLVVVNGAAHTIWAPNYSIGTQVHRVVLSTTIALEHDTLEQYFDMLEVVAPNVAHDELFRAWRARAGNCTELSNIARIISKFVIEGDVREARGRIWRSDLDPASCRLDFHSL